MIKHHPATVLLALALGLAFLAIAPTTPSLQAATPNPIPTILDTDIGDDIDDTWALGLLLKSPELELKLVVGDKGKPLYRAKLIAKLLERANRTDVAVGMALDTDASGGGRQSAWVEDYNLNRYPGRVYPDGVQAMIDLIMASPEPVTVIGIGPLPNIREALRREPGIAGKARFVGMHGSVRKGYGNSDTPSAEYNVRADVPACQATLSAGWPVVITPLDTCGLVHLTGPDYTAVRQSKDPICVAIMQNYAAWLEPANKGHVESRSSTLFDPVAVYLAFTDELTRMEELPIRVTDDGHTVIDPKAKQMTVATSWKDLDAFERWLAGRLTR